ncbi:Bicarbonate transport ATP-binding protein CmpD [Rubripirellula reticaptiva]|uniref:Bicarbonate transport ATP-binding protein CmpD n=1 Tax=Rubripirellula reticaptiva TaxID=2528013 RepID=A0A5C6F4T9_9BACT|nr:Bicarbonate transport ATP-binding protein CmpD [Rubripirellula reticaptiva]
MRAVEDVTISAVAGEILALVGPSGCGKTTLLRLMAGLESPTSGQVTLRPPASGVHGEIAFVFQQPTLLPWRTALENVTLPLELISRGSRADRRAAATDLLARVGLSDAMHRFPNQLSGGMKMRVSIARALVTGPSVLLLDEPFAALDDMLRTQLGELLLQLWDERRFTAVMVTHNIGESIVLSHRIAVMRAGRVIETLDSPLPFPRSDDVRSAPEFARFYGKISASLRGNA